MEQREYLIGSAADIMGVSSDTLRFYEKIGLLKTICNSLINNNLIYF